MIKKILDEFSLIPPPLIECIKYESIDLFIITNRFGFSAETSWRILKNGSYLSGLSDFIDFESSVPLNIKQRFSELEMVTLNQVRVQNRSFPVDPCFEIENNLYYIEIFSDDSYEPWGGFLIDKTAYYSNGVVDKEDWLLFQNSLKFDIFNNNDVLLNSFFIENAVIENWALKLTGSNWEFTTACGWRVDGKNEILFGKGTSDSDEFFLTPTESSHMNVIISTLIDSTIIDIRTQSTFFPYDPVFVLDDGRKIEIFSDRAENSWEFEVAGVGKWVASPKNEKVISFTPA